MKKLAHDIILKPVITEESMMGTAFKKYTFKVATDANKVEIAEAVEKLFKVEVAKVNTMNVRGRQKRMGRYTGTTAAWKKAIVKSLLTSIFYFFILLIFYSSNNQRTIRTAKAKRVAENNIDLSLYRLGGYIQLLRVFIRILEIDIRGNKVVLHHQHRIDNLACSRHPHLVTCERLR